jgi:hypothetical protein
VIGSEEMPFRKVQVKPDASVKRKRRDGDKPPPSTWVQTLGNLSAMIGERTILTARVAELDHQIWEVMEQAHQNGNPTDNELGIQQDDPEMSGEGGSVSL